MTENAYEIAYIRYIYFDIILYKPWHMTHQILIFWLFYLYSFIHRRMREIDWCKKKYNNKQNHCNKQIIINAMICDDHVLSNYVWYDCNVLQFLFLMCLLVLPTYKVYSLDSLFCTWRYMTFSCFNFSCLLINLMFVHCLLFCHHYWRDLKIKIKTLGIVGFF